MNSSVTHYAKPALRSWLYAGLVVALLVILYGVYGNGEEAATSGQSALLWMVRRWNGSGGDLSHAWLIPLVSAYVVWRRRHELLAAQRSLTPWALLLVALFLMLHPAGVRIQQTRITLISLVGLTWALPLYFWGWGVARLLVFPCAYLLFCIPLSFLDGITVPLRLIGTTAAATLVNGLGVPVEQIGTSLRSAAGGGIALDVADPCSGLRSILALTALAAVYANFTQKGIWRQWLLFLASVPIAMAGNIVRLVAICLVAAAFGQQAAIGLYHDYSGYIVFVVGVGLLMGFGSLLARTSRWPTKPPP
jgi:exosortase